MTGRVWGPEPALQEFVEECRARPAGERDARDDAVLDLFEQLNRAIVDTVISQCALSVIALGVAPGGAQEFARSALRMPPEDAAP